MSDSEEDLPQEWIPYSLRPEWDDVVPLAQNDGESPVVEICYSDKFKDVYDYFRAILAKKEKSERALELTKDALQLNPANYTVWQYRRDILVALKKNLVDELSYIDNVIENNSKNYQVWHHRRVIVEMLNDPSQELRLTEEILQRDSKNYHAWQHRQWVIKTYNLYDNELTYVDKLIAEDVRNNSAWNQRYFVLKHTGFSQEILQREILYVINRIRFVKNNESSWNFLRGLLQNGDGTLDQFPEVVEFTEELYEEGIRSPFLIAFLIDLFQELYIRDPKDDYSIELAKKVFQMCTDMANIYDKIRSRYWLYYAENFRNKMNDIKEASRGESTSTAESSVNTSD